MDDFALKVALHRVRLFKRAVNLTRNLSLAEDLTQATILRALEARDTFKPNSNLNAWLHTIMYNMFLTNRRKDWRLETFDHQEDPELAGKAIDNPESVCELANLVALIRKLNPDQRAALLLLASGMTYDEAAAKLGVCVGTVKSRVSRARAELLNHKKVDMTLRPEPGDALRSIEKEIEKVL